MNDICKSHITVSSSVMLFKLQIEKWVTNRMHNQQKCLMPDLEINVRENLGDYLLNIGKALYLALRIKWASTSQCCNFNIAFTMLKLSLGWDLWRTLKYNLVNYLPQNLILFMDFKAFKQVANALSL